MYTVHMMYTDHIMDCMPIQFKHEGDVEMVHPLHRDVIEKSQLRSMQYGITPTLHDDYFLESAELKIMKDREAQNLREILPQLEKFLPMIYAEQSMLLLSNRDGYIVHSHGESHFLEHATKVQLMEGAGWSEHLRGTNAIGTAILERSPVYVLGDEHYCDENHTLYCAASPIFDPAGELLAILDVSGYAGDFHQSIPFIVDGIARQIEDWLLFRHEKSQLVLEISDQKEKRFLLAFDHEGQISGGNREARTLHNLKQTNAEMNYENVIHQLFPQRDYHLSVLLDRRKPVVSLSKRPSENLYGDFFCCDKALETSLRLAKRAALTDLNVLITGESGTGKELVANYIHQHSERRCGSFIAVNCGAIAHNLMHSELFGYEAKTFTGAAANGRAGKFEVASGGTLFLDEIAEMSSEMQVALLRVLQEKVVTRIGGHQAISVNVRLVAATNKDLWEEVKIGRFRLDLYFRLLGVQILLPPLRERTDKVELAEFLLAKIAYEMNAPTAFLDDRTKQFIESYDFPGNVRELFACLRQGVFLADQGTIQPEHMPIHMLNLMAQSSKNAAQVPQIMTEGRSQEARALCDFYDWAIANRSRFYGQSEDAQARDYIGRWDATPGWKFIAVLQTRLKEFLIENEYNPLQILASWRDNEWIETAGGRKGFTKYVKNGGNNGTSYVVVKRSAIEKTINV